MARIDLVDLAHSYSGNAADPESFALKPVTMTWRQGGAYALLGPSGCGKTTLLNLISGIVTPSRGKILFDAVDITPLSTQKRNIAQVFQFPVIYDTMTVGQNLAFPLKNRGVPKGEIDARVAEIARLLDLTPYLERKATRLTAEAARPGLTVTSLRCAETIAACRPAPESKLACALNSSTSCRRRRACCPPPSSGSMTSAASVSRGCELATPSSQQGCRRDFRSRTRSRA